MQTEAPSLRAVLRGLGPDKGMSHLARTFPCFRNKDAEALYRIGVEPWDPERFLEYATSGAPSHGVYRVCRFLLSVWNEDPWEPLGRFDLHDLHSLDWEHEAAIAAWFREPWFP